jgi:hypothetical protein
MTANIIYEDKISKIKLNNDVQVKDILLNLQNDIHNILNLDKTKELRLLDDNLQVLEEDEFIHTKSETEKTFYLYQTFKQVKAEEISEDSQPIDDLITEVTEAKVKLKKKYQPNITLRRSPNIFRIRSIYEPVNFNRISVQGQTSNFPLVIFTTSDTNLDYNYHIDNQTEHTSELNEIEADENLVFQLNEMGFPEDKCKRALVLARNNIDRATDILLNDELDYLASSDNLVTTNLEDEHANVVRMEVDDYFDYNEVDEDNHNYVNNNAEAEEGEEENDYDDEDVEENTENDNV